MNSTETARTDIKDINVYQSNMKKNPLFYQAIRLCLKLERSDPFAVARVRNELLLGYIYPSDYIETMKSRYASRLPKGAFEAIQRGDVL